MESLIFHPMWAKTRSSMSNPTVSLAASVQYIFQGQEVSDCSQKQPSKGSCSEAVWKISAILSTAFKGSGSEKGKNIAARSNEVIQKVQLLSYLYIRIWWLMWTISDIKSGKLSSDVNTTVASMNSIFVGSEIYPTIIQPMFITIPTTVQRVQAHWSFRDSCCKCNKSRYKRRQLCIIRKQFQSRQSDNFYGTFDISYLIGRFILL